MPKADAMGAAAGNGSEKMHLTAFRMKSDVSSNQLNTHPFISTVVSPLAVFLLGESSAGLGGWSAEFIPQHLERREITHKEPRPARTHVFSWKSPLQSQHGTPQEFG